MVEGHCSYGPIGVAPLSGLSEEFSGHFKCICKETKNPIYLIGAVQERFEAT